MRNVEGAKAGSNQKKPYRAPVSVTSTQRMRIKYGISEGTIRGFSAEFSHSEMLKRIYLDGTPIMSAEGDQLLDVVVEFRDGSRDQEPINGLPSISVEHDVGVEVKFAAPVSRSFDRSDTTSYDVRISVPTLYQGDDEGNSNKGQIQFKIDVSTDGGAFEEAGRFEIYEKILNGFAETYNVVVPKGSNHVVRISRLNNEVVSDYSVNRLVVEAITENTDVRLRYTNTAVLYLEYDAEQFSNVPKLEMRVFGKNDILVPANYNGDTHTYVTSGAGTTNGVWDGTWKRAYTDNPVWIALDLMISRRYGLGDKIDLTFINKWELYGLAQYCDEAVADGKGGLEPRFTCNNMYLQKSEDAYRVLKDLAASFRAKVVWDGEFITLQADVPRDPVHTFSNANASDITYSSTQDSAQRNLINVQYYDRDNKFASDVVMQRSNSNILSRGKVVDGNFTALGCASQGQAQRIASYVMNTELYETELVSFTTGLEGGLVRLNDVIQMADNSVAGQTVGGRIAAVNGRSITLDRKIPDNVQAIATTQLSINRQDVKNEPISIVSISDDRMTAVLASDAPAGTEAGLVWALLTQDLVPQKFVVTDIEFDSTNMTFAVSAIQYNESKYAAIDGSARIVVPPISVTEYKMLKAPIIVIASYLTRIIQDAVVCDIDVSWAQSTNAVQYQLEMQKAGSDWRIVGRFMSLATTLDNMYTGTYTFRVCAYDSLGNASQYTYSDPILVAGKVLPPPMLTQYNVIGILFGYQHKWTYPAHTEDSRAVRLRFTTTDPVASPSQEWQYIDVAYPTANFTEQDVTAHLRTWFSAAIVDKYGNVGAYTAWLSVVPSSNPAQVLDLLDGQLTAQQLDQDLTNKIAIGAEAALAAESAQNAADAAAQAATNAQAAADQAQAQVTTTTTELRGLLDVTADGLTQEILDRQNGDANVIGQLTTYKTSNDAAMSAVQQQAEAATSASSANATALTNLNTEVVAANNLASNALQQAQSATDATSTNASNLIALSSRMDSAVQAGDNLLVNSNVDKPYNGNYPHGVYNLGESWEAGATYTLLWCASHKRADSDTVTELAPYAGDWGQLLMAIVGDGTRQVFKTTFVASNTQKENCINFFLLGSFGGHLDTVATVHWAVLVKASDINTKSWVRSKYDVDNAINANAQAIRNTETAIDTIDGKVTAQATDILNLGTGLTNLNNSKLDASIIQRYRTAADQDSVTTSELTQFKSALKIGGDNLFTGTKTFNNQSSENSTSSFYPSYGGFGGNTQEFLPNALFGTHTVVKSSSSWCGFYLREADGISWEAQEDMVVSFWANASADVHVYGIASQLGNVAVIQANQPMTKYEVLIPKGKPLRNSSNRGIIEFYFPNGGELWYGAVMLQVGTKSTSWQPSSKDNELDTSQFASATALENLTTNVSNIDGVVSSHTNQINAHQASINTALDIITIRDTRYDDFPPSHYRQNYALKEVREFKVSGTISLPTWYPAYCTLVTRTQWTDASGGNVIQRVEFDDPTLNLYRKSNDGEVNWDTWSAWENKLVGSLSAKADATYVNEINNKVTQAENGLTALSNTVTENAASLVNNINLFRNSGFDATPIDGHHWQGVYWEGNEGVQMSVENWGHWNIMRIRASADGQAFSGIAQELAFDDYRYTGKQLQFRFLTSSAITRNMRLGVHYRDGAGATAHQEWRTFTHTAGYTNLHTFTLPAVNGIYSLRVMITEETSQSAYDWALIQPSFNTGNAPIREYVPSSQDGLYVANAAANVTTQTRAEVSNLNGQVTALAVETNTLSTTVGNNTAAIQLQQSSIDGISAKATLQVEAGGVVGGVALGNNGGVVDFLIRSNTFAVAPPAGYGGSNKYLMTYRATPITLPNGTVVSEGLYLNNLVVDYVDASRIYADTLSALSASIGTLTSTSANGTMTLNDLFLQIKDGTGQERIFIGIRE